MKISVTILTKNSSYYLKEVLDAVSLFDEVLIYDTGSADQTLELASAYPNVRIEKGELKGFGPTHNTASELARNDWILSIDSDEVVTAELSEQLQTLPLDRGTVYAIPRHNYYNGKWIRWCGWYPDYQLKLYNKKATRFTDARVHESVKTEGMQVVKLEGAVRHYSYRSLEEFLEKMQLYSTLFAEQNRGTKSSGPVKAYLHALFSFFKSYVLKRGFMGGYEGYVISTYNAHTAFYKYMKLYEANKNLSN